MATHPLPFIAILSSNQPPGAIYHNRPDRQESNHLSHCLGFGADPNRRSLPLLEKGIAACLAEAERLTMADVKAGRVAAIRQGITFGRDRAAMIRQAAATAIAIAERSLAISKRLVATPTRWK